MKKFLVFSAFIFFFGMTVYFAKTHSTKDSGWGTRFPAAQQQELQSQQVLLDSMIQKVVAINDKSQVKTVAQELIDIAQKAENKNMPGVQMLAGVARIVVPLEGFIWRSRNLVDEADWLHATILFKLRNFANYNYLYGTHVDALFDYFTSPAAGKTKFNKVSDLQDFVMSQEVRGTIEELTKGLYQMDQLPAANFEFEFDRTLLTGSGKSFRYIDVTETKKRFIKPYLYTMTFLMERLLGTIYYASVLELDQLTDVANSIVSKTAINVAKDKFRYMVGGKSYSSTISMTPKMFYQTVEKYPKFLTKRASIPDAEAQARLDKAYQFGLSSAYNQLAAYVCGIKYPLTIANGGSPEMNKQTECAKLDNIEQEDAFIPQGSRYLFNPNEMLIDGKKQYHAFRDRYRAYFESKDDRYVTITSDVTGKPISVNIRALFKVRKDWKDFFASQYFEAGGYGSVDRKTGEWAWNYKFGKPIEFKDPTFNGFFSKAEVKNGNDVYNNMTTLLYTDAIKPFAAFLQVPSPVKLIQPMSNPL